MMLTRQGDLAYRALPGRASADPLEAHADVPLSMRLVRMTHDPQRRPHRHPHSCEVVHVLAGTGTAWQAGERVAIAPGDTFVVPTGVAHATLPDPGATLELLCTFPHPDLAENLEELPGPVLG